MLDIDLATLLFQVVNFVVLALLLNRFLFTPLKAKLDERNRTVAESLSNAQSQEASAAQLKAEWQDHVLSAERQTQEMLEAAQREAMQSSEELFEDARLRLDQLSKEMRLDLDRQRNEILVRNYDDILDAIVSLAGNVVQSVTTRRTHDDLVTNFAASIYQMPQADVNEYRRLMTGRVPTAFVATPVALTSEQEQTVADTLSSFIDRRVELKPTVDTTLIAGIQVRLADKLFDNSVREQLNRVRERVRSDLAAKMGVDIVHGSQ